MGQLRPLFVSLVYFKYKFYNGIRTQIVSVEGEHADNLTTTTA